MTEWYSKLFERALSCSTEEHIHIESCNNRPSGITSHQASSTIWSYLIPDQPAFKTPQHSRPPYSNIVPSPHSKCPLQWCTLHSYWPLICFRSLALFFYDLHSLNNAAPHALNVFKYWSAHVPQSHKGGSLKEKEQKRIHKDSRAVTQKHPRRKKNMERSLTAF